MPRSSSCRSPRRSSSSTWRAGRRRSRSSSTIRTTSTRCKPTIEEAAQRPVFMTDWRQRNQTFFSALQVERNVMFMILTLIVLVAALNIISGLIMLVKDKGRDIAILRTMGASRGAMMRIFLMTGAAIGVAGTFAGVAARHRRLPQHRIHPAVLLLDLGHDAVQSGALFPQPAAGRDGPRRDGRRSSLMALGLSFLATLFPAWRAARSIRSKRCGTNDGRRRIIELKSVERHYVQGAAQADDPERRRFRAVPRRDGGAGRAVRRRQVDAAAHGRPAGAPGRRRRHPRRARLRQLSRRRAHGDPPQRHRLRLPVPSSAAGILGAREHHDAAADRGPARKPRRRSARDAAARLHADRQARRAPARPNFPAASSSAWRSPARWPTRR